MTSPNPVTVILQAKNEGEFIRRCIESVVWADQILLLDSGSDDATVEIAQELGADVIQTPDYPGWAEQFNRAADAARNDWVFAMDCDEIVTPQLAASIQSVTAGLMNPKDGYAIDRRGDFLGILLPNSSNRKNRLETVRLYHRGQTRFAADWRVHEQLKIEGTTRLLDGELLHWRGYCMDEYFKAFNGYATLEAQKLHERGVKAGKLTILSQPILRFLWLYIRKGEWRLGTRGLIHAGLKACSEFMRYSKLWEMENVPDPILHPPPQVEKQQS